MKKILVSFLIVFFMMSTVSIYNLGYLTNSSFNTAGICTIVEAKGSSGGFKSGGFSSGSSSKSYSSGGYSAPKSNAQPKTAVPPATGGSSSAQTAPRTSFFPMFMPFGWGGGWYGGYGMFNPFSGIFSLLILAGIVFAVIWFIRKRNSK